LFGSAVGCAEALRSVCSPRRVHAIHVADNPLRGEPIRDRQVFSHALGPEVGKYRKLRLGFGGEPPPEERLTGQFETVERATFPQVQAFVAPAKLGKQRFLSFLCPSKGASFIDWMQCVDHNIYTRKG